MKRLALLVLLAPGCRTPAPPLAPDDPSSGVYVTRSNAGTYDVEVRVLPNPIPLNEPFELEVRVRDATGGDYPEGPLELEVSGWMPDHLHGMARVPVVHADAREPAAFDVEGMLFHMPGRWELFLDLDHGPLTERAELRIELE